MKDLTKDFWVGCLVLLAVVLLVVFGWIMGAVGPFQNQFRFGVLYDFAGGIEVGAPVRVAGIKVGKVQRIDFLSREKDRKATLKVTVSVADYAASMVRQDSKFYVNMAGIIGERYIEISPGSTDSLVLQDGAAIRGEDPPRIDQLLSQGYGVFGKIQDFLEENELLLQEFLGDLKELIADANKILKSSDRKKLVQLLDNVHSITSDMKGLTKRMASPEADRVFEQLRELIHRAHQLDGPQLKKFLQEEGIRARIF